MRVTKFEHATLRLDQNDDTLLIDPGSFTAPLHDRNGDVVAVMEFHLKPFPGQIESTTVARILPTLRKLESGITGSRALTD